MGRKIRNGALLILVLAIIYTQQAVIYAQNEAGITTIKTVGELGDNEESENPGGEDGGKEDTDNSGEEDGDGDKEDPDNPGSEDGDKEDTDNSGEEDGDKEVPDTPEPDNPGGEDGDKKPEIKKYELEIPDADGKNGYYISKPVIKVTHNGCYGATVYELKHGEEIRVQGKIKCEKSEEEEKRKGNDSESRIQKLFQVIKSIGRIGEEDGEEQEKTEITLGQEAFEEGKNILHIFMVDEEGNRIPEYDETIEFLIDTQSPTLALAAPEGFSTWYQKEAWIDVTAEDGTWGSQIDTVTCYVGNIMIGKSKDRKSEFLITQTSSSGEGVSVTVTVTDQAGNKTEKTEKLFIDSQAPTVTLTGAEDYLITSRAVTVEYQAVDENKLESCQAMIDYERPEGEKEMEVIDSEEQWSLKDRSASLVRIFQEDGIYKTSVQAVDKAYQKSEQSLQFIIDTKNPVIKMVDELQGKYLKKFSWDYPVDVFIKDFTTFVHQIQMDGRLYPIGTEISTEGRHTLQVDAVDAAGNEAVARAEFIIDHTPPKIRFYQVEEGTQYEGILNFQVDSEKKEDRIEEVLINGKRQTLKKEDGKYAFQITNPGEYEVSVKATDLAGNEAQENISFEVVPEKTILEKAAEPIKKILSGNTDEEQENLQRVKENRQFAMLKWIVIGSIIILLIVIGAIWYMYKKDNVKEEQIGKE